MRICEIESRKSKATWPSTCSDVITTARCSRGSLSFGSTTGYGLPRNVSARPSATGAAWAFMTPMLVSTRVRYECWRMVAMRLERASAIVDFVVSEASGPVSVFVADDHGELVAAATMDGAAPDTRLNAQRKAYTAARSDARSTRELAEKARADAGRAGELRPVLHVLPRRCRRLRGRRPQIGAVGVSGLPGRDRRAARAARDRARRLTHNSRIGEDIVLVAARVETSDDRALVAGAEPVQRVGWDRERSPGRSTSSSCPSTVDGAEGSGTSPPCRAPVDRWVAVLGTRLPELPQTRSVFT